MKYRLADTVLIVHLVWVLGVLVPIPLIVIGSRKNWRWIRNYPIRLAHLLMIGIVVAESLFGIICPLTLWEDALRKNSEQTPYGKPFIEYWVGKILFYNFPTWVFTAAYVLVGGLILSLFWKVPPKLRE
jgi:hypothetical protein